MQLEGLQIGSYRLLRLIGNGGMGDVYLASDMRVNRQIAIKVIQVRGISYSNTDPNNDIVHLFQREMKAIARLDHPHILPFFDCGEINVHGLHIIYMVMPYRREGSLLNWLNQHLSLPLSLQDIAHFLHQAADALQYAHDQNIIHRDVKPSNFLIRENKEDPHSPDLLLADFGLAKISTMTSTVSRPNHGTPVYMAPEHWDSKPVPASDQYALAVMAYELLTGRPPFLGNQQQVMYQHLQIPPSPPSKLNSHVPSSVDMVIIRALAKKPEGRFPSISAFAHAFQQAMPGSEYLDRAKLGQQALEGSEYPLKEKQIASTPVLLSTRITRPNPSSSSSIKNILIVAALAIFLIIGASALPYIVNINNSPNALVTATPTAQVVSTPTAQVTVTTPVPTLMVTPIPSLSANPYPPYKGTLAFTDPLHDNSNGYSWDEVTDSHGSCAFTGGSYHVNTAEQGYLRLCAEATNFSNFVFQVQMTITSGDYGGILFRIDSTHTQFYSLRIGQDGTYELELYGASQSQPVQILKGGFSSAIKIGLNQANVIAVVASGSDLDLFVNHQHLAHIADSTYSQGQLGVFAEDTSRPTEVAYSNAEVWQL